MATVLHLEFLKLEFLTASKVQRVIVRYNTKIRAVDNLLPRYGHFSFLNMAAADILNFLKLKIVTARRVTNVELRHHAKFRDDRSNRCRDIAVF